MSLFSKSNLLDSIERLKAKSDEALAIANRVGESDARWEAMRQLVTALMEILEIELSAWQPSFDSVAIKKAARAIIEREKEAQAQVAVLEHRIWQMAQTLQETLIHPDAERSGKVICDYCGGHSGLQSTLHDEDCILRPIANLPAAAKEIAEKARKWDELRTVTGLDSPDSGTLAILQTRGVMDERDSFEAENARLREALEKIWRFGRIGSLRIACEVAEIALSPEKP